MRGGQARRYDGDIAVVTGASSGIGRRIALDLARRGATVVGVARRGDLLAEVQAELRRSSPASDTAVCDVADEGAFRSVLEDVERRHTRIDVLVNNAGVEHLTPVEDGLTDAFHHIIDVNFYGVVTGTLAVLPGMLDRRTGIVVNVSSDASRAPDPRHGAYSASKAAVAAFTESVAHEVAGRGVHVHALYPAWVPTAMGLSGQEDGGRLPPKAVRRTEEQVSALTLERMGGPRMEINAALVPLLAPLARTFFPTLYKRAVRRFAG
ncbi:MAG TPA: SDR family NAD(P)-dependent oxidoreductase [Acidimicrobiales bacterium]|nr:SDR family NAD(P)-dependent oxidoreductase [Acidimicrobiales bacterium]